MAIPRKPKDIEEFIKDAKANKELGEEETRELPKTKKFLIELPYELWMKLKLKAVHENKPLKNVILEILEKNTD